jgi:hypothetical protein
MKGGSVRPRNKKAEHLRQAGWSPGHVLGLFICAKNSLIAAKVTTGPGTKTFEIDQNFEPVVREERGFRPI